MDDDLSTEANLGTLTDEQWIAGHSALVEMGDIPPEELTFIWDPTLNPADLIDPAEVEEAPRG
jgi:hypothetical protein